MLTDRSANAYIEDKLLPQQHIRRLACGSIDYAFYDQRAREGRGIAVRAAIRSATRPFRLLANLLAGGRATWQPQTEQSQAQPWLSLVRQSRETATASHKTYSEAA
jgi:hypothetical protein